VKAEGHPTLNNVCFLDVGTGKRFLTRSTMKSARKETIDGEEYFVVIRDITMDSHPAYTGEKRLVDTAGRVEKFTTKFSAFPTTFRRRNKLWRSARLTRPLPARASGFGGLFVF